MPRIARLKAPDCTYHIIIRGNNREKIFRCDEDRIRFLMTLQKFKIKYNFILYAYVLMDNHVHMIINPNGEDISKIMQSINISYTYYFNKVYGRCGHLFQDRFKSLIVDDDNYIINLSKYIHNNPKRAGIVPEGDDYIWSSCRAYTSDTEDKYDILDSDFILKYYSEDVSKAKLLYYNYMLNQDNEDTEKFYSKKTIVVNKSISNKKVDIPKILDCITKAYNLPIDDLLMKNNRRSSDIRNECMYIVRLKSGESCKTIGKLFGEICESAVSTGINKAINRMISDKAIMKRVLSILEQIA